MTDIELDKWGKEYKNRGMEVFSPPLCDIGAYLCTPSHVANVYGLEIVEASLIIDKIINENADSFKNKFRTKRQEANKKFWTDGGSPDTAILWPDNEGANLSRVYGKELIALLNKHFDNDERRNLQGQASEELAALLRASLKNTGLQMDGEDFERPLAAPENAAPLAEW